MQNSDLHDIFDNFKPDFQESDWQKMKSKLDEANRTWVYHFRYDLAAVLGLFLICGGFYFNFQKARNDFFAFVHPVAIKVLGLQTQLLSEAIFEIGSFLTPPTKTNHNQTRNVSINGPKAKTIQAFQTKQSQNKPQEANSGQIQKQTHFFEPQFPRMPRLEKLPLKTKLLSLPPTQPNPSVWVRQNPKNEVFSFSVGFMNQKNQLHPEFPLRQGYDIRFSAKVYKKLHLIAGFEHYPIDAMGKVSTSRTLDQTPIPFLSVPFTRNAPRMALTDIPYSFHSTLDLMSFSVGLGYEIPQKKFSKLKCKALARLQNSYSNQELYRFQLIADDRMTIPLFDPQKKMGYFEEYYGGDTKLQLGSSVSIGMSLSTPIFKGIELGIEPFINFPLKNIGVYQNQFQTVGFSLRMGYSKTI
jgi:hypothetical protein